MSKTSWFRAGQPPSFAACVAIFSVVILLSSTALQAQTLTVLYRFSGGPDGGSPAAPLVLDGAGNLYGTTTQGGDLTCPRPSTPNGCGTVFEITPSGVETVLYTFKVLPDAQTPYAAVLRSGASLYGTTAFGGTAGNGTVFRLSGAGTELVMHSFNGNSDGHNSYGAVVRDLAGNLYGTTQNGGSAPPNDFGTVFKIDASGVETILHAFGGGSDGAYPEAGLLLDKAGNLYGTTSQGGNPSCGSFSGGCGTVFKIDVVGNESVLYGFSGSDGKYPFSGLISDAAGNLYGTTMQGGAFDKGSVFKLDSSEHETVLYSFQGGTDGYSPMSAVVRDGAGNIYGTTSRGGVRDTGTIYKINSSGTKKTLHAFVNSTEGSSPSGLVRDSAGNLYGTTFQGGGTTSCSVGCGTVLKLSVSSSKP